MTVEQWLLVAQAATTWFMTGVIWFVQVVHYPLFENVGTDGFARYEARHVQRTGWVVAPPMLLEATLAVATVWRPPETVPAWQAWIGLGLIATIWLSTFLRQVPAHRRLAEGFDTVVHRMLVTTNVWRTVAWSFRAGLVTWWLV